MHNSSNVFGKPPQLRLISEPPQQTVSQFEPARLTQCPSKQEPPPAPEPEQLSSLPPPVPSHVQLYVVVPVLGFGKLKPATKLPALQACAPLGIPVRVVLPSAGPQAPFTTAADLARWHVPEFGLPLQRHCQ
jgi:hypothetical protein